MSNLSKTTFVIIFQDQLVMVVAPKARNFGRWTELKFRATQPRWVAG